MSRPYLLLLLTATLGCKGCEEPPAAPVVTLPEAADEATFASVEKLGPHRCTSSITRVDSRDGKTGAAHTEVAEIAWRSWSRFRFTRTLDGRLVSDAVVVDDKPWARAYDGPWEAREDAETFRVQLESTWDSWDTALEPFGERIVFTDAGRELIEGRWAQRYTVSLGPDPEAATAGAAPASPEDPASATAGQRAAPKKKARAHRSGFTPLSLNGTVWIDEQSAVRLMASVEGQVKQGNLVRSISLKLSRSDFDVDLNIDPPPKEQRAKAEPPSFTDAPPPRPTRPTDRRRQGP